MVSLMYNSGQITELLQSAAGGNRVAVDALVPLVYDKLQHVARGQLRNERSNHTLNTSALVHEAYEKLIGNERIDWKNRAHFYGVAALSMRRILINYAKARTAEKRGGKELHVTYQDDGVARETRSEELIALDEALSRLEKLNERQSLVVSYAFFGGMKHEEIAQVLNISIHTVRKDWQLARAWLRRELSEDTM